MRRMCWRNPRFAISIFSLMGMLLVIFMPWPKTEGFLQRTARQPVRTDDWGRPTREKAEFYAAGDVPKSHVDLTKKWYEIASDAWGNFGPLEFWIVGHDVEAAKRLDDRYCRVRQDKDPNVDIDDCRSRSHNFESYATDGNAGLNTQRHEFSEWSGFIITMASKNPGPEESDYKSVTLHEYFHVYQQAHVFSKKEAERESRNQKNPWWTEGGAEYMAQLLYSRQPGIPRDYLREKMKQKLRSLSELKQGETIRDIPYGRRGHIAYDLGAWFVAFVIGKSSEDAFLIDFYGDLNELDFEGSFERSFGASSQELLKEFHDRFLKLPEAKMLEIIPAQ